MKYFHGTKKLLAFCAFASITALAVYGFLFLSIRENARTVSRLANEAGAVMQRETKLSGIRGLVKDIDKDLLKLESYIVGSDEVVNFIEAVEKLSEDTGADVKIASVGVEQFSKDADEKSELLRLNFTAQGSWGSVFHTLSIIESFPFNITLTRVNLEEVTNMESSVKSNVWSGSFSAAVIKRK